MPRRRGTLPPPDWSAPRSVSGLALEWLAEQEPLVRRRGEHAELAALERHLEEAQRDKDTDAECDLSKRLARTLAHRGLELDRATKLARRSLMLGEDRGLREELSVWFAGLGEPALAAATLRPLEEATEGRPVQSKVLQRIAVFSGRTGNGASAAQALGRAAAATPDDPVPSELLGAIGAWDPESVPPEQGAEAYLEGARRREAAGDAAGAFEDVLRAFELAPQIRIVAHRLATTLAARGRTGAADEVMRESALAAAEGGRSVHRNRMNDALGDGDLPRALGAAFDGGLDGTLSLEELLAAADDAIRHDQGTPETFDDLLVRLGLVDVLAARLCLAAHSLEGDERTSALLALGRLYAGPLSEPEHAADTWVRALTLAPGSEAAKAILREHAAATGDPTPLVEAFVRVALAAEAGVESERRACLQELMLLGEQRLADPVLATWAAERLLVHDGNEAVEALVARLDGRVRAIGEELEREREAARNASGAARLEHLSRVAGLLESRPTEVDELISVLSEICQQAPDDRRFRSRLLRVLERSGESERITERLLADVEPGKPKSVADASRALLAEGYLRAGRLREALSSVAPALESSAPMRASWSMALATAAELGDPSVRARAIECISHLAHGTTQAVLCSAAAEQYLAHGDRDGARRASTAACRADPGCPRAMVAFARAHTGLRNRVAALGFERAMGAVVPRSALCRELAETFDALGEPAAALAWTQRWLALRPGDPSAVAALLSRVVRAGNPARLADTLSWLLAQSAPIQPHAELVASAICGLAAVDPNRGVALARRVLDVAGPRIPQLRDAVLTVADSAGEASLAVALLERDLTSGTPGTDRAEILLDLTRRRRSAGAADEALATLVRALREGAEPGRVLEQLEAGLQPESADGEVAKYALAAEIASATATTDASQTAEAWRQYGAVLWDLVGDPDAAVRAWDHAADLVTGREGVAKLARDLIAFAGHAEAVERLTLLADDKTDPKAAGDRLACAAGVALDGGLAARAFEIAVRALDVDPARADVLAVAERAAGPGDIDALERAYDRAANGALGVYGTRAAHYRAARQLERRGEPGRALHHAIHAFEAVPAEGVTFVLMLRLAERLGDSTDALASIDRVASAASTAEGRAAWLRRAALVAGTTEEGKRQRVDVLLRAMDAAPTRDTLRSLVRAFDDLIRTVPNERSTAEGRFEQAVERTLEKMDGPDGARMAVDACLGALELFSNDALALSSLERGASLDASIDEFSSLIPHAASLARAPGAAALLGRWVEQQEGEYQNVGTALTDLTVAVAGALGDRHLGARALVRHAERNSDDASLVRRAQLAAEESGDVELKRRMAEAIPPERRADDLLVAGRAAQEVGDLDAAIAAFEQAHYLEGANPAQVHLASQALIKLYSQTRRFDALETLLREELNGDLEPEERWAVSVELVRLFVTRDRPSQARELALELLEQRDVSDEVLEALVGVARRADDPLLQAEVLETKLGRASSPSERLGLLRRIALLYEKADAPSKAIAAHEKVLEIDGTDLTALGALEREAERRDDYHRLAELLERRATDLKMGPERRRVMLRRAEVLETRLGRLDEAESVLEGMLEGGDDPAVLRQLADIRVRLGEPLRAAPLWLRASRAETHPRDAADLARRACRAFLDAGDVEAARSALDALVRLPRSSDTFALKVEVERRSENPLGLSVALEELALSSMAPATERAALLVEGARAAEAGGDSRRALAQAQRAARIAHGEAEPQLLARLLEYQQRGAGRPEEGRATVTELSNVAGQLTDEQRELKAFLLAEALDVSRGAGEGMRCLSQAHAELGDVPLVAVGMAERLSEGNTPERSLSFFDAALAGDLRGLRNRGHVAIRAAEVARELGDLDRAVGYLDKAAAEPTTRVQALELQAQLRTQKRVSSVPPPRGPVARGSQPPPPQTEIARTFRGVAPPARGSAPTPSAASLEGAPDDEEPVLLTRPSSDRADPGPRGTDDDPVPLVQPRTTVKIEGSTLPDAPTEREAPILLTRPRSQPASEAGLKASAPPKPRPLVASETASSASPSPPGAPEPQAKAQPEAPVPRVKASPTSGQTLTLGTPRSSTPAPSSQRGPKRTPSGVSLPPVFPTHGEDEAALLRAVEQGSVEAGRDLVQRLEREPSRSQDLVNVCRRVAQLLPGDLDALRQLHAAALSDGDHRYAEAIDHVVRAFEPDAEPIEPPALVEQIEQADGVRAMLLRDGRHPVCEALGLVWTSAHHVFRHDAGRYGVTGRERIAPSSPLPVGRLFAAAATLLGSGATPLFMVKDHEGPLEVRVALLQTPAVVIQGEVGEPSPEVAFRIGAAIAGTLPDYALALGASDEQLENVLIALQAAFGPPRADRGQLAEVATLAGMLWETVPARAQRRLSELCEDPAELVVEHAVGSARQVSWRFGLFVCADLPTAVRQVCGDLGIARPDFEVPGALAALCASTPAIADLVQLATSSEFADARWHRLSGTGRQLGAPWSRF